MKLCACLLFSALLTISPQLRADADVPFIQEEQQTYRLPEAAQAGITCLALDGSQIVVGTEAGVWRLDPATGKQTSTEIQVPVFDLDSAPNGGVLAACMDGLVLLKDGQSPQTLITRPVAVCATRRLQNQTIQVALGPDGMWIDRGNGFQQQPLPSSRALREAAIDNQGTVWIATGMGLTASAGNEVHKFLTNDEVISTALGGVTVDDDGQVWAGGLGGLSLYEQGQFRRHVTSENGLPSSEVTCLSHGPDGRLWIGTTHGLTRFDGHHWSTLYSRRWLPHDLVRDIAFDADGTAWIATPGGISAIRRRSLTLAEKAQYFHEVSEDRHVRAPGFEEKIVLRTPGDLSTWRPEDTDNDGGFTAMHVVMECHRFAVTGAPDAKARARRGFDVLHFLEEVTGVDGFFARTVIPPDWDHMHDPNRTYTDFDKAVSAVRNPRYKPVEVRWRLTPDKKWRWKGDTSSDEVTSHFFAFHTYYDLVADEQEKQRVAALAAKIMDYIIDGGYVLRDVDGQHTRWGVWAPEKLNDDPEWQAERGINSVEILSYLKATWHMTGDEKYQQEYLKLLHEHNYADNVRQAKNFGAAWRTYIDDELLSQAYPALFKYETDPALRALYRASLDHWFEGARSAQSPFYNYTYAALSGRNPEQNASVFFLRDCPLDLINWSYDHTWREDITITRKPVLEQLSTSRLLPPSERSVVRWDKNQWMSRSGDGGRSEWSPTFWLLPYWIARYHGLIDAP